MGYCQNAIAIDSSTVINIILRVAILNRHPLNGYLYTFRNSDDTFRSYSRRAGSLNDGLCCSLAFKGQGFVEGKGFGERFPGQDQRIIWIYAIDGCLYTGEIAPICANWTRFCGLGSVLAPLSINSAGVGAAG